MRKINPSQEAVDWYNANQDRIEAKWSEYISELEDSYDYITYVSNSEECFWEFVEDLHFETITKKKA